MIILPTVLRGFIPAFRRGLCYFALGLQMLKGQVYSYNKCVHLNVEPGSKCLDPKLINKIKAFFTLGIAMIEGAIPPSVLKPSLHTVGHYPDHAALFGILWW